MTTAAAYPPPTPAAYPPPALGDDHEAYPAGIGVSCDFCGTTNISYYVVTDAMSPAERFAAARAHLIHAEGWLCTPENDRCPTCAAKDPALHAAQELLAAGEHVHLAGGAESHCLNGLCLPPVLLGTI